MFCVKCGKELQPDTCFCAYCGQPITASAVQSNTAEATTPHPCSEQLTVSKKTKKSGKKAAIVLSIVAGVLVALSIIGFFGLGAVRNLLYEQQLQEAYQLLDKSEAVAESFCSLERNVWRDVIYRSTRNDTKKYTKNAKGEFYDDFNDALNSFYEGEKESLEALVLASQTIDQKMSRIKNPPSKYKEEYQLIKEMYLAYSELADLAFGTSSHSLNSFEEALSNATKAFHDAKAEAKTIL